MLSWCGNMVPNGGHSLLSISRGVLVNSAVKGTYPCYMCLSSLMNITFACGRSRHDILQYLLKKTPEFCMKLYCNTFFRKKNKWYQECKDVENYIIK